MQANKHLHNPGSIKFHVNKYLKSHENLVKDKVVVDLPAGNGITSEIIRQLGGTPLPFDLFPEYFQVENLSCKYCDAQKGIPLKENVADMIICQEGMEHFNDQLSILKEFNRVLKPNGHLLITTPNYSNLKSKLSFLLAESERSPSMLAPNEADSIWMKKQEMNSPVYLGHIFLLNVQKLRLLALLAGFRIEKIHFTRIKWSAVWLFPLFYPFIVLFNYIAFIKSLRKCKKKNSPQLVSMYKEVYRLSINPKILIDSHLMIEFKKVSHYKEVANFLTAQQHYFGET